MMGPDEDLDTLVNRKDHLNVLRYVRAHQLREPELVLTHGKELLGNDLSKALSDGSARLAALEQICEAALDQNNHDLADLCLKKIKGLGVEVDSNRFRRLLGRCLEAADDFEAAGKLYERLGKENPANLTVLQRNYCLLKAQPNKQVEAMEALNKYLEQNMADIAGWYEMAQLRMSMGDFKGAAYALEEVILACPLESRIHCELAEVYATVGGLENLALAKKHMAQSLELDPTNRRAQFGLVSVANSYLVESDTAGKKSIDEHEINVAKALVKYGTEQVLESYKGTSMLPAVKAVMTEYSSDS